MSETKALPKPVANFFFFLGVISALSFRAIILTQHVNPDYVRILWYIAVISNFIFFLFRYYISIKRRRSINSAALITKLNQNQALEENERKALIYLMTSIERSRENLNYLIIFILSGLAILIDIIMTLQQ